jgi:hypothetical protein
MTTWKHAALGVALVCGPSAFAEPPRPTIAQAIRDAKFKPGVTCKAASPGRVGSQSQLYQNTRTKEIVSKKEFWFSQALECRLPAAVPGFPRAHRMFDGSANFHSLGGAWTFDSWHEWDHWIEGMPPPDTAAVAKAVEDKLAILDWNFLTRTTQIYSYGLRPKAKVLWRDTTIMKTEVEAVVDAWDGGDLVKQTVVVDVNFRRDDPSAPWKAYPGTMHPVEISRRTPTAEEAKTLVSVIVQEKQKAAEAKLASLPKVEVPVFEKARDAQLFIYKVLLESPPPEAESYLRRLYSTINEEDLAATIAGLPQFKQEYCPSPTFKTDRDGVENKLGSSWTSIKVGKEGGELKNGVRVNEQWKLHELKVGLLKGEKLAALKSFDFDLCSGTLPNPSGGVWKAGDRVDAKSGSQWYSGPISSVAAGGAWVTKDNGRYAAVDTWHSLDQLREATTPAPAAPVAVEPKPAPAPVAKPVEAPPPFAIGDRVEGNPPYNARWFPGTVAGFNSARTRVQIKFDDKTTDYLPFDRVRKL